MRSILGIGSLLVITACSARPTGIALTPAGQAPPVSGRVLGGTIKGANVKSDSKVALSGHFLNALGTRLDALGQPTTADILLSVPVQDGRYGFDLPVPPSGVARGVFGLVAYNDANGNHQIDAAETRSVSGAQLVFTPNVGYGVSRAGIVTQDPTALGNVELTFD